jgi:TolA protein
VTEKTPITVSEPEWERGLGWMVVVSLVIHIAIIAVVLLLPNSFLHRPPPPLVSYTVDLVAPDKVGGTNVLEGGKGRVAAAPLAAGSEAAKPAEPKHEAAHEPAKAPEPREAKAEAPKLEEPPRVKPEPPEPPKSQPKPPAEEPVRRDEMVLAMKHTPRIEPSPVPTPRPPEPTVAKPPPTQPKPPPTVAKAPPTPAAKPEASPKAVAKAQPTPAPASPKPDAKATEARKVAEARATAEAKKVAEAQAEATKAAETKAVAEAKAAADAKKAAEAKAAAEAKQRDEQIAAAVRRAEQRLGERGGGTGTTAGTETGGAVSVGPGEGAGGTIAGVEYLLYYNQMISRIKESWAWASRGRVLEAVIRFSISETGEVHDVRIVRASGDASFDASVERAVRAVNPLQPPPAAYRKEFADVELTFRPEDLQM